MNNLKQPVGERTRDLPACSIDPQPNTLAGTTGLLINMKKIIKNNNFLFDAVKYETHLLDGTWT
jgi:hypothetical protein